MKNNKIRPRPIGQHYTLVKRIAFHLRTRLPASIATDDLIQAGMEGLIHAQRAFEPSRGIEFEMFAKTRIRGVMLMKFDVFRIPLDLPLLLSASKIRLSLL